MFVLCPFISYRLYTVGHEGLFRLELLHDWNVRKGLTEYVFILCQDHPLGTVARTPQNSARGCTKPISGILYVPTLFWDNYTVMRLCPGLI